MYIVGKARGRLKCRATAKKRCVCPCYCAKAFGEAATDEEKTSRAEHTGGCILPCSSCKVVGRCMSMLILKQCLRHNHVSHISSIEDHSENDFINRASRVDVLCIYQAVF